MNRFIINKINWSKVSSLVGAKCLNQNIPSTIINKRFASDETTILVQNGTEIQELPVIVRKIRKNDLSVLYKSDDKVLETVAYCNDSLSQSNESNDIFDSIDKCLTTKGVLTIIDTLDNLSPILSFHALEKIIKEENLLNLKILEDSKIITKIINCITEKGSNFILLKALNVLKDFPDLDKLILPICNELLVRNVDNKLTIEEICSSIIRCDECKRNDLSDNFWTGLSDKEKSIDHANIAMVYKMLPHLKTSRRTVLGIVERKITGAWWKLDPDSVADILISLEKAHLTSFKSLFSLSRWLYTNIHAVDETQLGSIVKSFTQLDHTDSQIERALERYIKAKGVKIKSTDLIISILNHCVHFRLRNIHILNGCSEHFISNSEVISVSDIKSYIIPYGALNYQPLNGIKFWQSLESYLDINFGKIPPADILNILLSCICLEKYPMNFVKRVFNPYFLDALHRNVPTEKLNKLRSDLKLFDFGMSLECESYDGPLLPRDDYAKSVWQDGRIKRIIHQISNEISKVAGGDDQFSKSVILSNVPFNELFIVDILLHPPGLGNVFNFNTKKNKNIHVAVLVHLPEHLDSSGEYLNGLQSMRIRNLRKLGMKVVTLNYSTILKLKMHPKELVNYLVKRMKMYQLPVLS